MAQFHSHTSVYSRADGHSAVAASAYQSRSCIVNERDGARHDYRRCHRHEKLVADLGVILPAHAPKRWLDRSVLWNEVEITERGANAQLCRRIQYSLPVELDRPAQLELALEIARWFADEEGMPVDVVVHDALDGHNPHAHMLMPLRGCDDDGFLQKSVTVYDVRDAQGRERQATAAELKQLNADGGTWEKVYKYRLKGEGSGEPRLMTPTEAGAFDGIRRLSKHPAQSTRYLVDWNDKDKNRQWRELIANKCNAALEREGFEERVSHLSYAERGIDKVPTVYEGYYVRKVEEAAERRAERLGVAYEPVTDRRRENERIRRANEYLLKLVEIARQLIEALRALAGEREARKRSSSRARHAERRQHQARQRATSLGLGK